MEIKYILAIFVIGIIYCLVSYKQGYKAGFKDGKRHALFTLEGDIKK